MVSTLITYLVEYTLMSFDCIETSKCVWAELEPGSDGTESINDYRILRNIGSGSFGYVKLGVKPDSEDEFALKIMNKSKLRKMKFSVYNSSNDVFSITGLVKVFREIEILKQLNHWNVISLHEVIHDDEEDVIIIVTNYVSFGPLFTPTKTHNVTDFHFVCNPHVVHLYRYPTSDFCVQDIKDMTSFPSTKSTSLIYLKKEYILLYLSDIIEAVSYIHNLGIAHRDIKPSNLLLSSSNTIVLADFGCAEQFNNYTNPYGNVSDTVGTPAFWAPECIAPEKYATTSDIGLCLDSDDKPLQTQQPSQRDSEWSGSSRSDPPYSRMTTLNSEYETDHHTVYQYSAYALDMWAVGITLYAMCYNSLPFYSEGESETEVFELIVKHDPMVTIDGVIRERVGEIYHLPEEIRFIMKNLLEKYPHNRWNIEDLSHYDWLRTNVAKCQRYGDVTDFSGDSIVESSSKRDSLEFRDSADSSRDSEFFVKCVIFLDVDGVLTMSRCLLRDFDEDDPTLLFPEDVSPLGGEQFEGVPLERSALMNLKWIIDQSHADIVLSSTWRQMDDMRRYLLAALASVGIPSECVVGDTECMPLVGRGGEISHWLRTHPEYTSYVVLDDGHQASILEHCGERRFVQTILQSPDKDYSCEGLTKAHAIKALKILLGKYNRGDDV